MPTEADLAAMLAKVSRDQEQDQEHAAVAAPAVPASRTEAADAPAADQPKKQTRKKHGSTPQGAVAASDSFFVERVVDERLGAEYCWSPQLGWMHWNGKVWENVDETLVRNEVREYVAEWVAGQITRPTAGVGMEDLIKLLSKGRISAVTDLSRGILHVDGTEFDTDPDVLTVGNGVIDLKTSALMPYDKDRYLTRYAPTRYVPDAQHADVDLMLTAVEDEVRPWLQVRLGQAITGHVPNDDVMLLLQGDGHNAKSTLVDACKNTLGGGTDTGAMTFIDDKVLTGDRDAKEERMALRGARLAVAEELPEGSRLNVVQLKKAVGTSVMKARHLYQREVQWDTSHSLIITTNYIPTVSETDHGTWRRLALVPFPYTFVAEPTAPTHRKAVEGLKDRVVHGKAQNEALLAWLVNGAKRWYAAERRFPPQPTAVARETRKWRTDSDIILKYWTERLTPDPEAHVMTMDLVNDFTAFLKESNQPAWSEKTITGRFESHEETKQANVARERIRRKDGLSRAPLRNDTWNSARPEPPMRYMAWLGVRFVSAAD
ncbi:phage/plasmid primase, P4 family [Streptomyces mirabilis]|uniref:DNA primase family protein n=1 Tax=Streptomyces mirabilis TaxID=68239 RepID=UPI003815C517